jgi:hypothetical protein
MAVDLEEVFWFLPDSTCFGCLDHWQKEPYLQAAFAEVGMENGKSMGQMAQLYFRQFHDGEHPDRRGVETT